MDSNSKKIAYIVTAGEYSDYGILAVFSALDLANAYVESYNKAIAGQDASGWRYDSASVEEWEMDIRE